jgi:hypothetical protein
LQNYGVFLFCKENIKITRHIRLIKKERPHCFLIFAA